MLMLVAFVANAQKKWPFELWHEGKVVLSSADTIHGFIKYDLHQDIVQFTDIRKRVELYTAQKVLFFEIFDQTVKRYRRFYTLPYNTSTGYRAPVFFELLEEGPLTLLAREYLEYERYSSPYFVGSYTRPVLEHKFYFLTEDGDIQEFSGKWNDLLALMGKRSKEVETYARDNRLKIDEKLDFARIIDYYNSLAGF